MSERPGNSPEFNRERFERDGQRLLNACVTMRQSVESMREMLRNSGPHSSFQTLTLMGPLVDPLLRNNAGSLDCLDPEAGTLSDHNNRSASKSHRWHRSRTQDASRRRRSVSADGQSSQLERRRRRLHEFDERSERRSLRERVQTMINTRAGHVTEEPLFFVSIDPNSTFAEIYISPTIENALSEAHDRTSDQTRRETRYQTRSETRRETRGEISDTIRRDTRYAAREEARRDSPNETNRETRRDTRMSDETRRTREEARNETRRGTSGMTRGETRYHTHHEMPDETRREVRDIARIESSDEARREMRYQTRSEMPNVTRRETRYAARGEPRREARNETRGEMPDMTHREMRSETRREMRDMTHGMTRSESRREISDMTHREMPDETPRERRGEDRNERSRDTRNIRSEMSDGSWEATRNGSRRNTWNETPDEECRETHNEQHRDVRNATREAAPDETRRRGGTRNETGRDTRNMARRETPDESRRGARRRRELLSDSRRESRREPRHVSPVLRRSYDLRTRENNQRTMPVRRPQLLYAPARPNRRRQDLRSMERRSRQKRPYNDSSLSSSSSDLSDSNEFDEFRRSPSPRPRDFHGFRTPRRSHNIEDFEEFHGRWRPRTNRPYWVPHDFLGNRSSSRRKRTTRPERSDSRPRVSSVDYTANVEFDDVSPDSSETNSEPGYTNSEAMLNAAFSTYRSDTDDIDLSYIQDQFADWDYTSPSWRRRMQGKGSSSSDSESDDNDHEKCAICLKRYKKQHIGTPSSCEHNFCFDCIRRWAMTSNTCPVDRSVFEFINVRHSLDGDVMDTLRILTQEDVSEFFDEPQL